ncbi:MAG TPA: ABC transporter permease [Bacillales bacterium]
MHLALQFAKTLLLYLMIAAAIILVILFPREMQVVPDAAKRFTMDFQYDFTWTQYGKNLSEYFSQLLHGSLGRDRYNAPVGKVIAEYMPRSLIVIFFSFICSVLLGVLKGIFDYRSSFSKKRLLGEGTTSFLLSLPDFLVILCFQYFLITYIPALNFLTFGYDDWYSFIIPAIIVSIYPAVYVARITSTSIASQEKEPYVQVARAKGFTKKMVLYKHVLANCRGTILSHISSVMLYILSNLLIVEYLMDYRGGAYRMFIAFHFTNDFSMGQRTEFEPNVVIGLATCFMGIILVTHWIAQLSRHYTDPRRSGGKDV